MSFVSSSLRFALVALLGCYFIGIAHGQLYVSDDSGSVGSYNATTGAAIHSTLIVGVTSYDIAVSGNTLYVSNTGSDQVDAFNATTGAAIGGFTSIATGNTTEGGVAASGNTLYAVTGTGTLLGTYNATTGAANNASFITDSNGILEVILSGNTLYTGDDNEMIHEYNATTGAAGTSFSVSAIPYALALSGTTLYVSYGSGSVAEYNASTGTVINSSFITGLGSYGAQALALSGNILYVDSNNGSSSKLTEYNATTGAVISSSFISGFTDVIALAVTPEPSSISLLGIGLVGCGLALYFKSRQLRGLLKETI